MAKIKAKPKHETPTGDTLSKGVYVEEALAPVAGAPKRLRRKDGTELDRLLFAGKLSPDHHTTLERFRRDLYRAGMVWSPKSAIVPAQSTGQGQFMADAAFSRARDMDEQFRALAKMSRPRRELMLDAVIHDKRIPPELETVLPEAAMLLQQIYSY